eukprot:jgi/Ulvmu1/12378/UM009_0024.1
MLLVVISFWLVTRLGCHAHVSTGGNALRVRESASVRQRQLLDEPTDNSGLDPDTDDTTSWTHTVQIWGNLSTTSIGTHRDYLRYSPSCVYYNSNYLKGADWGAAKTLWQWVGGDLGLDCGYSNEASMATAMDPFPVALRVFATLTASTGYSLQCIEYIVSGSYSVAVRAKDGSYSWITGSSTSATIVSGGCRGPLTNSLTIDAITEYSTAFAGDKYILGYRTQYARSLADNSRLDAAVALSGPDGGVCAHELPAFRMPTAAANQPALDSSNGLYIFDRAAAAAASAAHYFEARSTFFLDLSTSGGFTAVVALRVRTSPTVTGTVTVLSLRGAGGTGLIEAQMGAVMGSQPTFRFTTTTKDYLTESVNILTGTWLVLAFRYVHSTSEWSIHINGVQEGNDAQATISADGGLNDMPISTAYIGTDNPSEQMDADVRYAAIYNRPLSAAELSSITTQFSGSGAICADMRLGVALHLACQLPQNHSCIKMCQAQLSLRVPCSSTHRVLCIALHRGLVANFMLASVVPVDPHECVHEHLASSAKDVTHTALLRTTGHHDHTALAEDHSPVPQPSSLSPVLLSATLSIHLNRCRDFAYNFRCPPLCCRV